MAKKLSGIRNTRDEIVSDQRSSALLRWRKQVVDVIPNDRVLIPIVTANSIDMSRYKIGIALANLSVNLNHRSA